MTESEYIEGLANILLRASPELELEAYRVAQAITDWHREQGLRVVPYEPTEKMKVACLEAWGYSPRNESGYAEFPDLQDAEDGYKAMLDAAKGDGEHER